jgi:hypothetical protein
MSADPESISEAVAKSEKDGGMTIVFDPERRRSTHVESSLAVQWVRDEPPMERRTHFKLIVDGNEVPFEGSYDYGDSKIKERFPDADALERDRLVTALGEKNFKAVNIGCEFDKEIFLETRRNLVSQGLKSFRVSTYYIEVNRADPASERVWRCEG